MDYENEFYQIDFSIQELQQMPRDHLAFFAASCLATDEIMLFQKLYVMARNTANEVDALSSDIYQNIASQNLMLIERNLAAKLFEYVKLYQEFEKRCERKKGKQSQFSKDFFALTKNIVHGLLSAPGYEIVDWHRNSVANHYSLHMTMELLNDPALTSNSNNFSMYLHEKVGGSHYILGEQLIITKFIAGDADWQKGMDDFRQWLNEAAASVNNIHRKFCSRLMDEYFKNKTLKTVAAPIHEKFVVRLQEGNFPIGWDFKK